MALPMQVIPITQVLLINIRPSANNHSMMIQDLAMRDGIRQLVQSLLGDVQGQ
ncbi:hypothetical protein PGN35_019845 [Nodosilinea sp. PGN35]|uniref:hypothetical protein n=1 Tax=Nodosilinea sp. PGN35 TaxID=3020489 RepID=UPI0023B3402C|nr:hypothetical protein [Nodosilinea sp. TSF1-S3]MDF0369765.1 hypothetical protein [Nodosilinea sp. TSF1-S3]